jgi:hypothetical protein
MRALQTAALHKSPHKSPVRQRSPSPAKRNGSSAVASRRVERRPSASKGASRRPPTSAVSSAAPISPIVATFAELGSMASSALASLGLGGPSGGSAAAADRAADRADVSEAANLLIAQSVFEARMASDRLGASAVDGFVLCHRR